MSNRVDSVSKESNDQIISLLVSSRDFIRGLSHQKDYDGQYAVQYWLDDSYKFFIEFRYSKKLLGGFKSHSIHIEKRDNSGRLTGWISMSVDKASAGLLAKTALERLELGNENSRNAQQKLNDELILEVIKSLNYINTKKEE